MDLWDYSLPELEAGFRFDKEHHVYWCVYCGETFRQEEVYPLDGRLLTARGMIRAHLEGEHGDRLSLLLGQNKKYVGLTDTQQELLRLMAEGLPDKEIARRTGTTPATVRRQRFSFREKAKQARLYLAICHQVFHNPAENREKLLPVHGGATMIDDRYAITEKEEQAVLDAMFYSLVPLKLKTFPAREKKKIVVLRKIAEQFRQDQRYREAEINAVLGDIYGDFATLRRYLIEYGFLDRTRDCAEYWRTK